MKQKTAKEILADSFLELAESKPVDKITIKDITDNCGYSTATFYRQFKDKYDLIAWTYTRDLERILEKINFDEASWKQTLLHIADYFSDHKEYLANLFLHTEGYDSFIHHMTEIHYNCLKSHILKSGSVEKIDDKTDMTIRVYVLGTVSLSCEWILGQYPCDAKVLAEVYEKTLPLSLVSYLFSR